MVYRFGSNKVLALLGHAAVMFSLRDNSTIIAERPIGAECAKPVTVALIKSCAV
jgi:hypothetical protein